MVLSMFFFRFLLHYLLLYIHWFMVLSTFFLPVFVTLSSFVHTLVYGTEHVFLPVFVTLTSFVHTLLYGTEHVFIPVFCYIILICTYIALWY